MYISYADAPMACRDYMLNCVFEPTAYLLNSILHESRKNFLGKGGRQVPPYQVLVTPEFHRSLIVQ